MNCGSIPKIHTHQSCYIRPRRRRREWRMHIIGLEFCEEGKTWNNVPIYVIQVSASAHKGVEIRKSNLDSYNMIFEFTNLVFNLEKLLY